MHETWIGKHGPCGESSAGSDWSHGSNWSHSSLNRGIGRGWDMRDKDGEIGNRKVVPWWVSGIDI